VHFPHNLCIQGNVDFVVHFVVSICGKITILAFSPQCVHFPHILWFSIRGKITICAFSLQSVPFPYSLCLFLTVCAFFSHFVASIHGKITICAFSQSVHFTPILWSVHFPVICVFCAFSLQKGHFPPILWSQFAVKLQPVSAGALWSQYAV
jgi:hypothetical protein